MRINLADGVSFSKPARHFGGLQKWPDLLQKRTPKVEDSRRPRQKLRILLQINLELVQVCYTSVLLCISLLSFAG